MTREEFRLLRDLVYEYCGIFFQDEVKYLLERRLNARLREHTLKSFNEYYRYLRYSPARSRELEEIVELLTTNETYFFREEYQLKAFQPLFYFIYNLYFIFHIICLKCHREPQVRTCIIPWHGYD